jgi:hypothetical protein
MTVESVNSRPTAILSSGVSDLQIQTKQRMSKTLMAKRLVCPGYQQYWTTSYQIILYTASHELLRLARRMWAVLNGWVLEASEILVESPYFKGYTDDKFRRPDQRIVITEYSTSKNQLHKIRDLALAAGYFIFVQEIDVEAELVTEEGVYSIPCKDIEHTWEVAEQLGALIEQGDVNLLELANPCYLCDYCGNVECTHAQRIERSEISQQR